MQNDRKCYITGYQGELDMHHIFHGPRRKAADKYGCWVWLRHDIHMELHDRNKELDRMLQKECQQRFEEIYSHQEFIDIFGKNYL